MLWAGGSCSGFSANLKRLKIAEDELGDSGFCIDFLRGVNIFGVIE